MRKWLAFLCMIALSMASLAGIAEEDGAAGDAGILIAYFSRAQEIYKTDLDGYSAATPRMNNTELLAQMIRQKTGADLFQIQTEQVYPVDHSENSEIAGREKDENARPVLTTHVENMAQYDVVILGYPIWWYTAPMAIRTFLEEYDFAGKRIVPYATSLGAGIGESIRDIEGLCPNAEVAEGLLITNGSEGCDEAVTQWLTELGLYMEE